MMIMMIITAGSACNQLQQIWPHHQWRFLNGPSSRSKDRRERGKRNPVSQLCLSFAPNFIHPFLPCDQATSSFSLGLSQAPRNQAAGRTEDNDHVKQQNITHFIATSSPFGSFSADKSSRVQERYRRRTDGVPWITNMQQQVLLHAFCNKNLLPAFVVLRVSTLRMNEWMDALISLQLIRIVIHCRQGR